MERECQTSRKPCRKHNSAKERENLVRETAYFKWLAATDGTILPEDPSGIRFWLEAEAEIENEY